MYNWQHAVDRVSEAAEASKSSMWSAGSSGNLGATFESPSEMNTCH